MYACNAYIVPLQRSNSFGLIPAVKFSFKCALQFVFITLRSAQLLRQPRPHDVMCMHGERGTIAKIALV
jgi:hypothetical protein